MLGEFTHSLNRTGTAHGNKPISKFYFMLMLPFCAALYLWLFSDIQVWLIKKALCKILSFANGAVLE